MYHPVELFHMYLFVKQHFEKEKKHVLDSVMIDDQAYCFVSLHLCVRQPLAQSMQYGIYYELFERSYDDEHIKNLAPDLFSWRVFYDTENHAISGHNCSVYYEYNETPLLRLFSSVWERYVYSVTQND